MKAKRLMMAAALALAGSSALALEGSARGGAVITIGGGYEDEPCRGCSGHVYGDDDWDRAPGDWKERKERLKERREARREREKARREAWKD